MKLFFLFFVFLFLGANLYVFYRAWQSIPLNMITRPLVIAFALVTVGSVFVYFFFGERLPLSIATITYKIGTSWIFTLIYFLLINIIMDLVRATRLVPKDTLNHYTKDNWLSFGLILGFVTLLMISGYLRYLNKERVDLPLTLDKNLGTHDSIKIVAISDLHLGYSIGNDEIKQWVELINKENPDVILLAGDIVDGSIRPVLAADMKVELSKLKAKYGVYAVPGNHEYLGGIDNTLPFIESAGIKLLKDETVLVDSLFYIVGRDDRAKPRRASLEKLTDSIDRTKPIIVLDHQPHDIYEAERCDVDLQISGHTHDGQVWPISMITRHIYEISHGYKKKGNTNVYVTSGIALWGGKFRIGTQSEYVVITIKNK